MIFKVEDGTGFSDSTSYVDVAYADSYISFYYPNDTQWSGKSQGQKELALVFATRFLDRNSKWVAELHKKTQALAWPRTEFKDAEGRTIDAGTIPMLLKDATTVLAYESLSSDLYDNGVLITSQKYGSSSETYAGPVRDGGNAAVSKILKDFRRLGYAASASTLLTVQRA